MAENNAPSLAQPGQENDQRPAPEWSKALAQLMVARDQQEAAFQAQWGHCWPGRVSVPAALCSPVESSVAVAMTDDLPAASSATVAPHTAQSAQEGRGLRAVQEDQTATTGTRPVYGSEDYAAVLTAEALRDWKYCHEADVWFRPGRRGYLPARSADAARICRRIVEEIALDSEGIAAEMRRPGVVEDVLFLVSTDRAIARPGYRA